MPTPKLILTSLVVALVMFGSVIAADKPSTQADIDKLQEQVRTLDKELAVQREAFVRKLDDVEKRQNEITAQQANSLAAIANQTTALGNYIAYTSAAITVIVFIAGIATYFSAKSKAEKEARVASADWFKQHAIELNKEIERLRSDAQTASLKIKEHTDQVEVDAKAAATAINAAGQLLLDPERASPSNTSGDTVNQQAADTVREASEALKNKPESEFTASDFYTRGLNDYSLKNYQSALIAFNEAVDLSASDASAHQTVMYLIAKGVVLGALEKPEEAIALYDQLDQRYSADTTPAMRTLIATALVNKGNRHSAQDKPQEAIDVYEKLDKRFGADTSPTVREQVIRALVNKGDSLGLLGKPQEAIDVYEKLDKRFGADTSPTVRVQVIRALVNKGATHSALGKRQEAIDIFEQIEQRFGTDAAPNVIALVGSALNSSSFTKIIQAKELWSNQAQRVMLLAEATAALARAIQQCAHDDRAMILGNLGYSLFLTGQSHAAEEPTLECLRLGGQKALEAQRADAKLHRVEPEDSQYEELLTRLWQSLPPITGAS